MGIGRYPGRSRILETFEALRCLIRKVDKRTLNARSAFHTTAGKPAETPFWTEANPGYAGTRYRSISACCSPSFSWSLELKPTKKDTKKKTHDYRRGAARPAARLA